MPSSEMCLHLSLSDYIPPGIIGVVLRERGGERMRRGGGGVEREMGIGV